MAQIDTRILCVDIGSDSVKAAEFSQPRAGTVLLEKYAFMENGLGDLSPDDPEYKVTVLETIRNLILANGFLSKSVYLSLSGQNAFLRFVKVPAMTDDPDKIQRLLEFEAKQNIPFDENEIAYDSQIIFTDTENAQVEAMFAIIKSSDAEVYMRCMESLKKKVHNVEIAATSSYNACKFNGVGAEQCEMVLNIGGRSSTLIFIDQDKFFVRTFLTAGHAITQQISKEFNISYDEAEELKIRHGFVGLGGAYEEPESVVASTVSKIIRNVMTRLHGEIIRTVNVYRASGGRKPEKMYLTGGSSVMTYTPHFFSEKLRIPVEYLNPFQVIAFSPTVNKEELASVAHLFSEVVGLAMRGIVSCPVEISLIPPDRKAREVMAKRMPYFYGSCLALLFCVFIIYWNFWNHEHKANVLKSEYESKSNSIKDRTAVVQKSNSVLNSQLSEFKEIQALTAERARWFNILSAIQYNETLKCGLPAGVWFTSIRGLEKVAGSTGGDSSADQFGFFPTNNTPAKNESTGMINYIEFKGHIIVMSPDDDPKRKSKSSKEVHEDLLNYIATCGVFEPFTESDIFKLQSKIDMPKSGQNISTFTVEAKLKVPFKR